MNLISACRSCGGPGLVPILSLGETPLANALLCEEQLHETEARYPLDLVLCTRCSLVQITATVPPETLFRDYVYFSSVSETMLEHAGAQADRLIAQRRLGPESFVLELGSNDGYLLRNFVAAGTPVLGVEPACNVAQQAVARGIPTIAEFFGLDLARRLRSSGLSADVILANNVMAHVSDLNGVVEGIGTLLAPRGVFVMETPYLKDLVDRLEFDTIYHEHLSYYSLSALEALFGRHGLAIIEVDLVPVHGGSLRVTVAHEQGATPGPGVEALLMKESVEGLARPEGYQNFRSGVHQLWRDLKELLQELKAAHKRVAAYGAAAKGAMLLNVLGLGRESIDFVVDRSPHKQGRVIPGCRLTISPPERLLEERPDFVLLLAWNLADEILTQQEEYRAGGGRFILPIPRVRVV